LDHATEPLCQPASSLHPVVQHSDAQQTVTIRTRTRYTHTRSKGPLLNNQTEMWWQCLYMQYKFVWIIAWIYIQKKNRVQVELQLGLESLRYGFCFCILPFSHRILIWLKPQVNKNKTSDMMQENNFIGRRKPVTSSFICLWLLCLILSTPIPTNLYLTVCNSYLHHYSVYHPTGPYQNEED
jgi:hypothetical protein